MLRERLADLPSAQRHNEVLGLVESEIGSVLGYRRGQAIPAEQPFRELGFDSLAAVELRNRLMAATGLTLSASVVFDYPTADSLAAHLLEHLFDMTNGEVDIDRMLIKQISLLESIVSDGNFDSGGTRAAELRLNRILAKLRGQDSAEADAHESLISDGSIEDLFNLIDDDFR